MSDELGTVPASYFILNSLAGTEGGKMNGRNTERKEKDSEKPRTKGQLSMRPSDLAFFPTTGDENDDTEDVHIVYAKLRAWCDVCLATTSVAEHADGQGCASCADYVDSQQRRRRLRHALPRWQDEFADRATTLDKERVNQDLVVHLEALAKGRQSTANVLTLDGADLYTSRTWIKQAGLTPGRIIVPNPFLYGDARFQTAAAELGVSTRNELVHDTLRTHDAKKQPLDAVFLDYCCTWEGDARDLTRPRNDIELLLERRLLRSAGALLAVTVSSRDSKGNEMTEGLRSVQRHFGMAEFIQARARAHGYVATVRASSDAYKGIRVVVCTLEQLPSAPSSFSSSSSSLFAS